MATAWKVGASVAAVVVLGWALWPSHDTAIVRGPDVPRSAGPADELLSGEGHDASTARVSVAESDHAGSVGANAAPKPGPGDTTSLDVHVRWGDDGTPAAGVVVRLNQWAAPDPGFDDAASRTDATGLAHFDGVFAGAVRVSCDRAVNEITHVVAGKAAMLDVTIPNGIDIDGLVVDENKVPVADARILISGSGADDGGPDIERSDARGKFHLRDVNGQRWIAALHDGFGPSSEERLFSHAPGSHADVVLSLPRSRGMVTGIVHDERGKPIPGAKVEIRLGNRTFTDEAGRNELKSFPSLLRFTDASGGFSVSDVGEGSVTFAVQAHGFVRWQRTFGIDFRGGPLDVRMSPEAIVHGVVRDAAGAPVDEAVVGFSKSPQESSSTYSRTDGSYRLEHLPRGSVEIHVFADEQGEDRRVFDLEPGQEIEWNVTLRSAASVEGIVTDDLGKPIAGWLVGAIDPERPGLHLRSTRTNDAGAFVLGNWPEKATAVEVRELEGWMGNAAAVVNGVKAGDKALAITIPPTARRTAFIRGRLFDMDARPAAAREVSLTDESIRRGRVEFTDADGRFRLGPLRPGSYAVDFRIEGQAPKSFHGLTLVSGQELDLGNVHLEHGGSLVVHLHYPVGTDRERAYPSLDLRGKDRSDKTSIAMHGDEGRLTTIASGEYDVVFRGTDLRAPKTHVTITSDHLTEIDMTVGPATSRSVQFTLPGGMPATTLVRIRLLDSSGEDVYGGEMEIPVSTPVGLEGLVVGTYSLEARIGEGSITRLPLEVNSLESSMDVIELSLH